MMEQVEDERRVYLPNEIWKQIISRLPTRSICHVKCVSKTWYSMITDIFSANRLGVKSLPTNLVILGNKSGPRGNLFKSEFWPSRNFFLTDNEFRPSRNLCMAEFYVARDYPSARVKTSLTVHELGLAYVPVASCNGLVLLIAHDYANPISYCVSNPILGQHMKLPFPKVIESVRTFCGFGFCPSTKLYKVIQFHFQEGKSTVVEVHTLGTYTWRDTQIVPPKLLDDNAHTGIYLNGALYWMVSEGEEVFIYCFDLENEMFSSIGASEFKARNGAKFIGEIGGHLFVSVHSGDVLDVFLMRSSWTRLFSTRISQFYGRFLEGGIEVINCEHGMEIILLGSYDIESSIFYLIPLNIKADRGIIVGVEIIRSRNGPVAYVPNSTSLSDIVTGDTYQMKFRHLSKKCLPSN